MKKDLITKWVEALRSERYVQGEGDLVQYEYDHVINDDNLDAPKHCCLGVLCDVLGKSIEDASDGNQLLSKEMLKEVGLTHEQQEVLSGMNDGSIYKGMQLKQHSFTEIAVYIIKHIKRGV